VACQPVLRKQVGAGGDLGLWNQTLFLPLSHLFP